MRKEDEEFLARVRKEEEKHGLVLRPEVSAAGFGQLMKRLIDKPPAPKRRKHKARGRRTKSSSA
jgi:hypothetical protein